MSRKKILSSLNVLSSCSNNFFIFSSGIGGVGGVGALDSGGGVVALGLGGLGCLRHASNNNPLKNALLHSLFGVFIS